jgi:hypothetical protein
MIRGLRRRLLTPPCAPQVNGFAARHEATGDAAARAAVANFFVTLLGRHSFSTGGSNWFEFWHDARSLGDAVNNVRPCCSALPACSCAQAGLLQPPAPLHFFFCSTVARRCHSTSRLNTSNSSCFISAVSFMPQTDAGANAHESCTQYNSLKIARALFRWTGDPAVADFYERALLNGVMGVQRRPHTHISAPHAHAHLHSHSHSHGHDHGSAASAALPRALALSPAEAAAVAATNALHAKDESSGRPSNYKVVSWPDDPARNRSGAQGGGGGQMAPGVFIYYLPLGERLLFTSVLFTYLLAYACRHQFLPWKAAHWSQRLPTPPPPAVRSGWAVEGGQRARLDSGMGN